MTARVPFALLGVVLLMGSGTLAGSLQTPAVTDPGVERAMDRASAESQSALRHAVRTAARDAAREPVTARANTSYGRVLNRSSPFRDALCVRVYLRVREALGALSERRGDVRVRASVPGIDSPADLRAAKRRVSVERAGPDGTELRVSVENVTLTATRDGRVVGTRAVSPTLVVPTPTLAVHDRVGRFERRLDAGPLDPGLGRRLTARLYPIVWARGYAQYGGAPIENVLANRHVALSTNGAVLALQRDLFGHSDPAGRHVLRRATRKVALTDLLAGTDSRTGTYLAEANRNDRLAPAPVEALEPAGRGEPDVGPGETITVGIGGTAERTFLESHRVLDRTLRRTYSARVELDVRVRHLDTQQVRTPPSPGPGWGVVSTSTHTTVTVRDREPSPSHDAGKADSHVLDVYGRTVVRKRTTYYRWAGPNGGTSTTTGTTVERSEVTFTLRGSHHLGAAPDRPIATVHERGGPFDGPNLGDVRGLAHEELVASRGGLDGLARRETGGESVDATAVVVGDRPEGLDEWVYADLARLRERVRNVSMTTTQGKVATFQANPAAVLAETLRDRRADLADVPETYPNVAQRARVAARTAYVDRVIEALDRRADRRRKTERRLGDRLAESGGPGDPLERLREGYERRTHRDEPGRLGGVRMRVDAEPAYLTRSALGHETVHAIAPGRDEYPLVTRNRNVMTLPYADIVDAIVETLSGPDTTRLRTAAQVLRAIERTNDSVRGVDRGALERQVRRGTDRGLVRARKTLAAFDLGGEASRRDVVADATSRWETPGALALAVTNGSVAAAIHGGALGRWPGRLSDRERDLLALRLEHDIDRAVTSREARPGERTVDGTAHDFRERVKDEVASRLSAAVANATREKIEDLMGRSLSRLPAGMPVAPAPGFWYATVNLWRVDVAGEYARFTVRVPRGTPDIPGAQLHYVREAGTVRLDPDSDGTRERLGYTSRVSFRTGTVVAVAVPPGPQGVGDVDGQAVEESPGWPRPGG